MTEGKRAVFEIPAAQSKEGVLQEFADALKFPAHFGHNLDALQDCLMDWVDSSTAARTLVWHVDPAFRDTRAHSLILEILAQAGEYSRRTPRLTPDTEATGSPARGSLTVVVDA